ncbi:MAG: Polyketide cyclase / dehydrase and lipid transport [bacterium ADurb.Bin478]|nr:MAG: Polyketide cyclase / dehydrase and lipid transport [bacterium ADurb.Bin478]
MKQITANEKAPVYARQEASINAPIQVVWSLLTDFEKWPEWNESVQEMHLQGKVEVGAEFRWKTGSMKICSRIEHIAPPFTIVWSGRSTGIRAMHAWTLTAEKNGTRVRTEESFEGFVAWLFARPLRKVLADALQQGLHALKKEAEKRDHTTLD